MIWRMVLIVLLTAAPAAAQETHVAVIVGLGGEQIANGAECTRIEVPLDYAEPDGRAIKLSVLRIPARSDEQRVGSLVVNPGGPGGSGVEYASNAASYFGSEVRQAFDIVGFDPRGVGRSAGIDGRAQLRHAGLQAWREGASRLCGV